MRAFTKRLVDIVVAATALVLLAPLCLIVAVLVWSALGRPILFKQVRAGHRGRPFTLFKFRTMRDDCDAKGKSLPDASRLTRVGVFLRQLSLDELPQFWNALIGDMSLVGPRPLSVDYLPRYTSEQARRHEVKPGITGWAQVNGRNTLGWEEKFRLDVWYVDHWSLGLDICILWITLLKALRGEGISRQGHATMPEFMGNDHRGL